MFDTIIYSLVTLTVFLKLQAYSELKLLQTIPKLIIGRNIVLIFLQETMFSSKMINYIKQYLFIFSDSLYEDHKSILMSS